jgi:diguanylate cyclase (GGDEF)-like protein
MKPSLLTAWKAPLRPTAGLELGTLLQEELERGFPSLRFEPSLENAYREDSFRDGLKHLRTNLVLLIALVLTLVQVDRAVIPLFSSGVPVSARLGVMLPILVIALGLTFLRRASVWYPRVMSLLMGVALMAIAWIGILAWSRGEDRVFTRLIIAIIAVYFVMGLRYSLALTANVTSVIFYVAAAVAWDMPALVLLQFLSMLLMASVICAAGGYNLEHARRTAWVEGRLLSEIAMRDGLTGIPNRRRFDGHLLQAWHQCLRQQRPVALLFADIDCFKAFNDHYGHQAGDEALKAVASVLARFGRRPLDMTARYGGEEFALVLFDTPPEPAVETAEAILEAVRGLGIAHARSTVTPVLTISVGVACVVPTTSQRSETLVDLADQALYVAKRGGRNRAHLLEPAGGLSTSRTIPDGLPTASAQFHSHRARR